MCPKRVFERFLNPERISMPDFDIDFCYERRQEVIDYVVNTINADPIMRVEYYEIVDGNTMESIKNWSDTTYPVGCITVYCGEVRLIDNIKY